MEKMQLLFKRQGKHPVTDHSGRPFAVEYMVFRGKAVIDAELNGITRQTEVRAFRLQIKLLKVDGEILVPLLNVDFGYVTPDNGQMTGILSELCRTAGLDLGELTAMINDMRAKQEPFFKEAGIKQFKKDIGFYKADPKHRQKLAEQGFLPTREVGRL